MHGWAVGDKSMILHTTNGGLQWTTQTGSWPSFYQDVFFLSPDTGWMSANVGHIMRTTNGGETWTHASTGNSSHYWTAVRFSDALNGLVVGNDGRIARTTNGGVSWTLVPSGVEGWLYDVHYQDPMSVWACGQTLLHSMDGGLTWEQDSFPADPTSLREIQFVDPLHGFICGFSGLILKTSDGGVTWTPHTSNISGQFEGLHFLDTLEGYVCGSPGRFLHTTDGGITWENVGTPSWGNMHEVVFDNAGNGWIAGDGLNILSNADLSTAVSGDPPVEHLGLYPNPNDGSAIWVEHAQGGASITLYDALGQQVPILIEASDTRSTLIRPRTDLVPGIYLVAVARDVGAGQVARWIVY
jgi:photosystem II stability/assembly factor-like uncharacterized protein